ncbi:MAG: YwaF family protein [Candidatus Nomurabacteria bacterium]|jgi:uncharacterized membrane protein YwaF|nr:YwaF family protein [Candidatus Nomurabacteria bacterium]
MLKISAKKLRITQITLTIILLAVSFASFFSFNYFYSFGHIQNFGDAIFTLLQWLKLAGLVAIPVAVFLKTKRFDAPIKTLLVLTPLLSLFWTNQYINLAKIPVNSYQEIYWNLNMFMPKILVLILFILQSVLMAIIATTLWLGGQKTEKTSTQNRAQKTKQFANFLPIFLITMPLNLFNNIFGEGRLVAPDSALYSFLKFKNFTVWHFLALATVFFVTFLVYRFLKNKSSQTRYKYLRVLALALLVQYMSKASMLIGDGYNVYYTILAFIPLFICNIGVPVAALAIFLKKKVLNNIAFFVHAAGALAVFVYFGRDEMSNFGTVFNYSFLYFCFTHCVLFMICVLPTLLGEFKFRLRNSVIPMIYYAVVIFIAAAVSQFITSMTGAKYGEVNAIYPNFAFTQNSPIANSLPVINVNIFGLNFDALYLSLLFVAYVIIFFVVYGGYYLIIERRKCFVKTKNVI